MGRAGSTLGRGRPCGPSSLPSPDIPTFLPLTGAAACCCHAVTPSPVKPCLSVGFWSVNQLPSSLYTTCAKAGLPRKIGQSLALRSSYLNGRYSRHRRFGPRLSHFGKMGGLCGLL